jgi:DNA-binding transcriptional ArsR family regulator
MQSTKRQAEERRNHAVVFAALGEETRLSLVLRLSDGSARSITQLSEGTGLTRQGVTKHLRILESAGVIQSVRTGRENLFEINREPLIEMKEYLEKISVQWDEALSRLKNFVEN